MMAENVPHQAQTETQISKTTSQIYSLNEILLEFFSLNTTGTDLDYSVSLNKIPPVSQAKKKEKRKTASELSK